MKNTGLENTTEMNGYQRVVKTLRFEKTDRAALIPEIIQHNLDTVTHAYYDLSLNSRYIRDDESSEMFDIMFANSVYDFGYIFDVGGLGMILENMFYNKKNTFSSRYASMEKKALAALEDIFSGEH